jgi:hypothetical protein
MKKILTEAVAVGNATARAIVFKSRQDAYLYPNSAWFTCFIGGSYEFLSQPGVRDQDALVHFIYYATAVTPAMAAKLIGLGSQYAAAATDSEGKPLDGGKTYKIHLPPNIPAKDFWSFVVYGQSNSLDAPNRSAVSEHRQSEKGTGGQRRFFCGCLVRPDRATRTRVELGADRPRQRLERALPTLWATGTVVRQDLAAWRIRIGEIAWH